MLGLGLGFGSKVGSGQVEHRVCLGRVRVRVRVSDDESLLRCDILFEFLDLQKTCKDALSAAEPSPMLEAKT